MSFKILVVDDEPDVALIFRQKFRKRMRKGEVEFAFAENGQQALEILQAQHDIAVVFTDINMPVMNGLALLREIRALQRPLLVPLIISAYDDMANIREAMHQGAFDFVTKPIDVNELDRILNKAIGEVEKAKAAVEAVEKLAAAEREKERAEYSKQLQREFFDNVTHEIRTPLTLLLGPVTNALELTTEDPVRNFLQQARRNGQLLLDLVNQLLDFARIDAEQMPLHLQPVEISPLLADLAQTFAPLAAEKDIAFEISGPEASITLQADPQKLLRILLNLLSNAFKFTPADGHIHLQVTADRDTIAFTVKDSGPGIPKGQQTQIFERFRQAEAGQHSTYHGTGIGLALSRTLAELHNGSLDLKSSIGDGATFTLRLPKTMAASALSAPESVAAPPKPVPAATPKGDENLPLVLLVEDNAEMRSYIEGFLAPRFRLQCAQNGRQGLEMAREAIPDLIISDWMMPEMDGVAMLELLRHDRSTSHIPCILLTAKAQVNARVTGLRTGAEAYLSKPFHPDELTAQIESLLEQRQRVRERFKQDFLKPEKVTGTSMEDKFVSDVKRLMEANLGNENFSVEAMADELAMSRRTLGRKLSALTGESPVRFIRNYRLERGRQMLVQKSAPVWEVALKTGFGSSSYFTKCFKDHYGISPREAVEQG